MIIIAILVIASPVSAAAGINKVINFQGKVVNSDGTNVTDGTYDFVIKIYDGAGNGASTLFTENWTSADLFSSTMTTAPGTTDDTLVYSSNTNESTLKVGQLLTNTTKGETIVITSVNTGTNTLGISRTRQAWANGDTITNKIYVKNGVFKVAINALNADLSGVNFNSDTIFVGVNFNSDGEMKPRIQFTSAPYALNAEKVNGLTVTNTSDLPFSSTTTLKIGDGKTVVFGNSVTINGTDSTTFTLPSGSGTVATLDSTGAFTNKSIGSTGLTFAGASTDITTDTDESFTLNPNGTGDFVLGLDSDTVLSISGTAANVQVANGGTITFEDSGGNDLLVLADAGAITIGSSGVGTTAITLATDGTGDAEVVLPTGAIATGEILNATILPEDLNLTTADSPSDEECLTYESDTTDFEWQSCSTGGATAWDDITVPTDSLSLAHGAHTTAFTFNSVTTAEAFKLSSSSLTSGNIFDVTSAAAADFTGSLVDINLSDGTGASTNTGNLLNLTNSGTANANTSLYIKHYATGTNNLAFRVDDVSSDSTPFVIDGEGQVGIGTTGPSRMLQVLSPDSGTSNFIVTTTGTSGQFEVTGALAVDHQYAGTTGTGYTMTASSLTSGKGISIAGPTSGTGFTGSLIDLSAHYGLGSGLLSLTGTLNHSTDISLSQNIVSNMTVNTTGGIAPSGSNIRAITTNTGSTSVNTANGIVSQVTDDVDSLGHTNTGFHSIVASTGDAAKTLYGYRARVTSTSTTADTLVAYDIDTSANISGIITSGTRSFYGLRSQSNVGAESTGGTTNVYALYAKNTADVGNTGSPVLNAYGLYVANGVMDTDGTTSQYGVYIESPTGADTNYALYSAGGTNYFGGSIHADGGISTSATNQALNFAVNGSGDFVFANDADSNVQITNSAAPGVDMVAITNTGQGTTTTDVDGVSINFTNGDTDAQTNAGLHIEVTSSNTNASSFLYGIDVDDLTSGGENASEVGIRIGTGWDQGLVIESGGSTNSGLVYSGDGRPTKTITLSPEYAGAVLTAYYGAGTDTNVTGSMTSDTDTTQGTSIRNYYQWERTTDATQHFYTVAVRIKLPKDFSAWATSNAVQISYITENTADASSELEVRIYNENDSTIVDSIESGLSETSWSTATFDDSEIDDGASSEWDAADETAVIYLRMGSASNNYVRVGDITLNYLAKF